MQTLIELPILRKINIIQNLVMVSDFLSEKDVAKLNGSSISTARNDIAFIQKESREIFGVVVEHGNLSFTKKNVAETTLIIRDLFSESLNIQLLIEIFDHPYQSRRHYCKATAISEASFYRALRNINSVIEFYGFSIMCYQAGYYLHANDEKELRNFIVSLYTETKAIDECFIRMPFEELKGIVSGYIQDKFTVNCDLCNSYYSYFAYISLIRKSQGFNMNQTSIESNYPEYHLIKHYFPHLKESQLFSIRDGISKVRDPWQNKQEKNKVTKIFDDFIDRLLEQNKMTYSEDIYQRLLLVCTLTYAGFELYPKKYKIIFNRVDLFIEQFKLKA